jgi:hypothetical protein
VGGLPGLGLPWRQSDFSDPEFRRSFARDVMAARFSEFRSIQTVPVSDVGNDLPRSWVQGRFTLVRPRFSSSDGLARLRFAAPPSSPYAWRKLVDLLAHTGLLDAGAPAGGWLTVAPGDWYRVRCDIDLLIDDGLAF